MPKALLGSCDMVAIVDRVKSGEGNEEDEVEGWGREAIKAVGDADFQWRRRTSAAKSAQAAAAPGPLRCLGEPWKLYVLFPEDHARRL
jgi:hypothetical protein